MDLNKSSLLWNTYESTIGFDYILHAFSKAQIQTIKIPRERVIDATL